MSKKVILLFIVFLAVVDFFVWREVFALAGPRYLEVSFLDVGQGDSAFIETPENHQILIDGGPDSSALRKLGKLMPFWDKTIDIAILTHPDADHVRGLMDILNIYKADYILWTGIEKDSPEYDAWLNVLEHQKELGSKILVSQSKQDIFAGDLKIETIFPFENLAGVEMGKSYNDTCVVNRLTYGEKTFLFTGDIGFDLEKSIVESNNDIKADVLKVAHHGSKYSTSELFLQAVKPAGAVIEVGKNSYGHPTPEVLNRLEKFGIKVFITQRDGDIKFVSDGKVIKIN